MWNDAHGGDTEVRQVPHGGVREDQPGGPLDHVGKLLPQEVHVLVRGFMRAAPNGGVAVCRRPWWRGHVRGETTHCKVPQKRERRMAYVVEVGEVADTSS